MLLAPQAATASQSSREVAERLSSRVVQLVALVAC